MKIIIAILLTITWYEVKAQELTSYPCDKNILTDEAYEKCLSDSALKLNVFAVTNYIALLQKKIFPGFRINRKSLNIPVEVESDLAILRNMYDSTLKFKTGVIKEDMYKNQKYVQPYAYISSYLALEIFNLYPDIYAILLNPIHLVLRPKTNPDSLKLIETYTSKIFSALPADLYSEVLLYSKDLELKRKEFSYNVVMFQGELEAAQKDKLNVLNFLLWTK